MADADKSAKPTSWWQTAPGILTGVAALITAVTGLLVAAQQAGLFGAREAPAAKKVDATPPAAAAATTPSAAPSAAPIAVEFAVPQTITVGKPDGARYTFSKAIVESRNPDSVTLVVSAQMFNPERFDANFWDRSFRLRAHDAVIAASGGLNELVAARSDSPVRELRFVVPRGSIPRALVIDHAGETVELPLRLLGW